MPSCGRVKPRAPARVGVLELGPPGLEHGQGGAPGGDARRARAPRAHPVGLQELRGARVVQHQLVEHQQARHARQQRVLEVVDVVVAELVHDEVVRPLALPRRELGGAAAAAARRKPRRVDLGLAVEELDLVPRRDEREELGRVVRDAARGGRQRRGEREAAADAPRYEPRSRGSGPRQEPCEAVEPARQRLEPPVEGFEQQLGARGGERRRDAVASVHDRLARAGRSARAPRPARAGARAARPSASGRRSAAARARR